MDKQLETLLVAGDTRSISVSALILILVALAFAWRYVKGIGVSSGKTEMWISAKDVEARFLDHEKRLSRIEGRIGMPSDLLSK